MSYDNTDHVVTQVSELRHIHVPVNHTDNIVARSEAWLGACGWAQTMHMSTAFNIAEAMDALGNLKLAWVADAEPAPVELELTELRRLRDAVGNFFYSPDGEAYTRLERAFERALECDV